MAWLWALYVYVQSPTGNHSEPAAYYENRTSCTAEVRHRLAVNPKLKQELPRGTEQCAYIQVQNLADLKKQGLVR